MIDNPSGEAPDEGHTLPPDALPPAEISRYLLSQDPHKERDVSSYVESQARDETVQHVELIRTDFIAGDSYEIWDVVTDVNRWWVITNLTNLYPQNTFPSLDFVLSLHVGLMTRMRSKPDGAQSEDASPFDEVFRRQEQAKNLYDRSREPEDFQAVGVQLRECLLSLAAAMRRRVTLGSDLKHPQEGNFIQWYELLADSLCPGRSNKELRQFLKSSGRDTWQLASWVVHDRNADRTATSIAIHSVDNVVGYSIQILERQQVDAISTCPLCKSRDLRSHYDPVLGDDGDYYLVCGACRWSNHPSSSRSPAA